MLTRVQVAFSFFDDTFKRIFRVSMAVQLLSIKEANDDDDWNIRI